MKVLTTEEAIAKPLAAPAAFTETEGFMNADAPKGKVVAIDDIAESSTNPRTIYDPAAMAELVASLQANGMVQPLVVRGNLHKAKEGKTWELIAGSRRLRAAKLAGWVHVPILIQERSDVQVAEAQMAENDAREDVHPYEQGRGYQNLVEMGLTLGQIAERRGHASSTTYVSRRIQFLNLIPEATAIFLRRDMGIKHAEVLAPLPQSEQPRALLYLMGAGWSEASAGKLALNSSALGKRADCSVSDLKNFVRQNITRDLSRAPWSLKDATLYPLAGACNTCPKNSAGPGALLFDDDQGKEGRCLDGVCYETKHTLHLIRLKESGDRKKLTVFVSDIAARSGLVFDDPDPIQQKLASQIVLKLGVDATQLWPHLQKCDNEATGIFFDGPNRGQEIRICTDPKCKVHARHAAKPIADTFKHQRDADRYRVKVATATRQRVWEATSKAIAEKSMPGMEDLRDATLRFWSRSWADAQRDYCKARGIEGVKKDHSTDYEAPVARLIQQMKTPRELLVFIVSFTLFAEGVMPQGRSKVLAKAAERYGVDQGEIEQQVKAELQAKKKPKAALSQREIGEQRADAVARATLKRQAGAIPSWVKKPHSKAHGKRGK